MFMDYRLESQEGEEESEELKKEVAKVEPKKLGFVHILPKKRTIIKVDEETKKKEWDEFEKNKRKKRRQMFQDKDSQSNN